MMGKVRRCKGVQGAQFSKLILFIMERNLSELNIAYDSKKIKQYHMAEYLGCHLDANLSTESMKSLRKINT